MKKLNYLLMLILMLGGCSYKNNPIALEPYKADYAGKNVQNKTTVFLSEVKDMRKDQRSIGYVLEDSKKTVTLYSEDNFKQKYKNGLGYALNIAGFNTNISKNDASIIVEVFIKDITLVYTNETFDENLKGQIVVQVVVKEGQKVLTFNFKQKSSKWITPSYNSKDIAPFLHELFTDSINDVVSKLATL